MSRIVSAIAVLATLAVAAPLHAATLFTATLTSDQETPSIPDEGSSGIATLLLSDDGMSLSYDIQLFGLDLDGNQTPGNSNDNVTRIHIHRGPAASPGPIVFGMIDGSPTFRNDLDDLVVDFAGGRLTGVWDMAEGNGTTLAAELSNLLERRLYLNVHTSDHGGGEIRGQIIPEPATMTSAALALLGFGAIAWRRKRAGAH